MEARVSKLFKRKILIKIKMKRERIYGFDTLRTFAMWLGLVLHTIIPYKATPVPHWPLDNQNSIGLIMDYLYQFIRIFRMPLFFFVAGFFAHLIYNKLGTKEFITNRFRRIAVPLLIFTITIVPISIFPLKFYTNYYQLNLEWKDSVITSLSQSIKWNGFIHLWFLYNLLQLYTITILFLLISKHSGIVSKDKKIRVSRELTFSILIVLSISIIFALLKMKSQVIPEIHTGIRPDLNQTIYFGIFYAIGWIVQKEMLYFELIKKLSTISILIGFVSFNLLMYINWAADSDLPYIVSAISMFTIVFGLVGIFIKVFNYRNNFISYMSESSYWTYIIHVIPITFLQIILIPTNLTSISKIIIIFLSTALMSLLTYQLFIKNTAFGKFLFGK